MSRFGWIGGGGSGFSANHPANMNVSRPAPTAYHAQCPVQPSMTQKCANAQKHADNLCDRIGSNEGLGKAMPGGDISDGLRCVQAQNDANKVCGK